MHAVARFMMKKMTCFYISSLHKLFISLIPYFREFLNWQFSSQSNYFQLMISEKGGQMMADTLSVNKFECWTTYSLHIFFNCYIIWLLQSKIEQREDTLSYSDWFTWRRYNDETASAFLMKHYWEIMTKYFSKIRHVKVTADSRWITKTTSSSEYIFLNYYFVLIQIKTENTLRTLNLDKKNI